jgi:TPR repeat protein
LGCLYKAGKDVAVDDRKAAYYLGIAYLARHEHAHRLLILLQQTSKLDFSAEIAAAKRQINEWELIRLSQSDNH